MPKRDLVAALSGADPTNEVLAVLANARSGYYANVPDDNLARDLEALTYSGPEERREDWERDRDEVVGHARAGYFRDDQEERATETLPTLTSPPVPVSPVDDPAAIDAPPSEPAPSDPAAPSG